MFKVGDKVKNISDKDTDITIGHFYTLIKDEVNEEIFFKDDDNDKRHRPKKHYKKLENTMTKYDELVDRIDNVTGWDKEADDITTELYKSTKHLGYLQISIPLDYNRTAFHIIKWDSQGSWKEIATFAFEGQGEKLSAFKQALMWLLEHSSIKEKTLVGKEVKAEIEGKVYKVKIVEEAWQTNNASPCVTKPSL